ncbi:MAG: hypothetical protein R3F37_15585 [Candidatus Competibacteraceae bacterium]
MLEVALVGTGDSIHSGAVFSLIPVHAIALPLYIMLAKVGLVNTCCRVDRTFPDDLGVRHLSDVAIF